MNVLLLSVVATCAFGESALSSSDVKPLEVCGRTTGIGVVRCREKFKVVVAVYVAVHQSLAGVEMAGDSTSQGRFIHSAS